jgi:hypothetical protein
MRYDILTFTSEKEKETIAGGSQKRTRNGKGKKELYIQAHSDFLLEEPEPRP